MSALRLSERQLAHLIRERGRGQRVRIPVEHRGRKWEDLFAWQLDHEHIGYEREYRYLADRKYRFDFAIRPVRIKVAVEIDGMVHSLKRQYAADRDKFNLALLTGWRVLHVGPHDVRNGRALALLNQLLGRLPLP